MKISFEAPGITHQLQAEGEGEAKVKISNKSPFGIDILLLTKNGRTKTQARYLLSSRSVRIMRTHNEYKNAPTKHEIQTRDESIRRILTDPYVIQCIHGYFGAGVN